MVKRWGAILRPESLVAILDASVLIPVSLADTLLIAAEMRLYRVRWSEDILDEVQRNLVTAGITDPVRALRRVNFMRHAFRDAAVEEYQSIVPEMTNHPKDRHVLAAAVVVEANVIVTSNLRDFPSSSLEPFAVHAWSPDQFLVYLDMTYPDQMIPIIEQQASFLHKPPMTPVEVLDRLSLLVPTFATRIRTKLLRHTE